MFLIAAVLAALLVGCRPKQQETAGPPVVDWTSAVSQPDGRPISDPRFAAAHINVEGQTQLFDDIGRLVGDDAGPGTLWVRDYDHDVWLAAEAAVYVASPRLVTPRGSGLLAVSGADRAAVLARELSGRVLAFDQVAGYLAAASIIPPISSEGLELGGVLVVDKGR